MSAGVKPSRPATTNKRVPAISAEQFQAIARPGAISCLCLETPAPVRLVVGRPNFVWKDNLDIARQLNDHFARDAEY